MTGLTRSLQTLELTVSNGVARLWLSRPEVHNAFNEVMIAEMTQLCADLDADDSVRAIVLGGRGKTFSAGADVEWMRRMAGYGAADNRADAGRMAAMLAALDGLGKPLVARVHGAALGGGVGLIACADLVVVTRGAKIGTTEVRLGILPSVIGPYVLRKIGFAHCRHHFLLGDRFDADEAWRIGLVSHVVDDEAALDARVDSLLTELRAGSPAAQRECKRLLRQLGATTDPAMQIEETVETIARARASSDGQEGLAAFLEKRAPSWSAPPTA
jgi:methylglutaconyl-CoA hydratase